MAAAVLAAAFLFLLLPLPERGIALPPSAAAAPIATGSFHIHTNRSDGSGSPDEVAAAAARAGLQFIVLTDHGDGTRRADPPQFRSGVLVIDAVELSTQGGHYIAIGLPQAPFPLRGEARDVVEDVRRLGGFGIVAHPDSAKPTLRWHDWEAPFDGLEWLNADSEWRDESSPQLARAFARYPFRPAETLASLLDRPQMTLSRWDALTRQRRVVAVAGADAHARAGWMDDDTEGYRRGWFLRIPSYDTSFRTFATRVILESPLDREPAAAAEQIVTALRNGRAFSAIDALASPPLIDVTSNGSTIIVRTNAPSSGVINVLRDGRLVGQYAPPEVKFDSKGVWGTYRAEVHLADSPGNPPVPWIVSNPIYVRPDGWGDPAPQTSFAPSLSWRIQGGPWHAEKDDASTADVAQTDYPTGPVQFSFRLGGGERGGQYAALGVSVGKGLAENAGLAFSGRASQPMRVSVQARHPGTGARWRRSVYLDATPREVTVAFEEMIPVAASGTFDPAATDTILFVVDTMNTAPGTSGTFTISNLQVER